MLCCKRQNYIDTVIIMNNNLIYQILHSKKTITKKIKIFLLTLLARDKNTRCVIDACHRVSTALLFATCARNQGNQGSRKNF